MGPELEGEAGMELALQQACSPGGLLGRKECSPAPGPEPAWDLHSRGTPFLLYLQGRQTRLVNNQVTYATPHTQGRDGASCTPCYVAQDRAQHGPGLRLPI